MDYNDHNDTSAYWVAAAVVMVVLVIGMALWYSEVKQAPVPVQESRPETPAQPNVESTEDQATTTPMSDYKG